MKTVAKAILVLISTIFFGCAANRTAIARQSQQSDLSRFEEWQYNFLGGEQERLFFPIFQALNKPLFYNEKEPVSVSILMNFSKTINDKAKTTIEDTYNNYFTSLFNDAYSRNVSVLNRPNAMGATYLFVVNWSHWDFDKVNENAQLIETSTGKVVASYTRTHDVPRR